MNKLPYALTINSVTNGYIVSAGCMTLVFNDPAALQTEISRYLANPRAVVEEYEKRFNVPHAAEQTDCAAGAAMGVAGTTAELRDWREEASPIRVSDSRDRRIDSEYVRGLEREVARGRGEAYTRR